MFIKTFLAAGFALAAAQAHALTLTHAWELNGSTADTLGGPDMVLDDPTGLGATGYVFDYYEGANMSGTGIGATYSMEMRFSLDDLSYFARIIDFKNVYDDDGLFSYYDSLTVWGGGGALTGSGVVFSPSTPLHLVLTRDGGTGEVALYADGVLALSFNDGGAFAVFDGPDGVIRLMGADYYNSSGFLDYVRLYSDVATASEALALVTAPAPTASPVPVPASLPLLAGALGGLAFLRRRKR